MLLKQKKREIFFMHVTAHQRCAQCVSNPVGPPVSLLTHSLFCSDQLLFLAHRSTGHFSPLLGWFFPLHPTFFPHSSFFSFAGDFFSHCRSIFWCSALPPPHRSTGHFPPLLGWFSPLHLAFSPHSSFFFSSFAGDFFPLPLNFLVFCITSAPWRCHCEAPGVSPLTFFLLTACFFHVAFFPWLTSPPPHSTLSEWHLFFSVHIPCLNKPSCPSLSHPQ